MRIVYHITPTRNLDSILRSGIIASIGIRSADLGETVPASYYFHNLTATEDALTSWLGDLFDSGEQLALLKVDIDGLTVSEGAGYEIVVVSQVAPDRITVLAEDIDLVVSIHDLESREKQRNKIPGHECK